MMITFDCSGLICGVITVTVNRSEEIKRIVHETEQAVLDVNCQSGDSIGIMCEMIQCDDRKTSDMPNSNGNMPESHIVGIQFPYEIEYLPVPASVSFFQEMGQEHQGEKGVSSKRE